MADDDCDLGEDGYPTERALERVRRWKPPYKHLMVFVKTLWWCGDTYFEDDPAGNGRVHVIELHTVGWSGNEDLVRALQVNVTFWSACWHSSRRGGHYVFEIPASLYEAERP